MALVAFGLRRYTNVKARAKSAYRRKFWRNLMRSAFTYDEWAHAAKMLERENPRMNESDFYDEDLVRNKLRELVQRRQEGGLRDIIFCLRPDLVRNLGNMCNPQLHKGRLQVTEGYQEFLNPKFFKVEVGCNCKFFRLEAGTGAASWHWRCKLEVGTTLFSHVEVHLSTLKSAASWESAIF